MNYMKIAAASTLIAVTPAIAAAGNLNANTDVEEVVIAPEEDDDAMLAGSLGSGVVLGGLALVALALALSGDDDSESSTTTTD